MTSNTSKRFTFVHLVISPLRNLEKGTCQYGSEIKTKFFAYELL